MQILSETKKHSRESARHVEAVSRNVKLTFDIFSLDYCACDCEIKLDYHTTNGTLLNLFAGN